MEPVIPPLTEGKEINGTAILLQVFAKFAAVLSDTFVSID